MIARSVVENIAAALTKNHNLKVFFRGSDCFATKTMIVLPSLPKTLPGKLVEMIRGYLDHEVGHIVFTDFNIVEKAAREGSKDKNALKFVLNCVEDIYVERKMALVYRGCGVNFDKSRDYTTEKLKKRWEDLREKGTDLDEGEDPVLRTLIFFIYICQVGWTDPFVEEYASDIMPLLEHLEPEIEAAKLIESTKESYDLAKKILKKIETFSIPEPILPSFDAKGSSAGDGSSAGGSDSSSHVDGDAYVPDSEPDDTDSLLPPVPAKDGDKKSEDKKPDDEKSDDEDDDEDEDEPLVGKPDPIKIESDKDEDSDGDKDEDDDEDEDAPGDSDDSDEKEKEDLEKLRERLRESLASDKERFIPSMKDDISEESKKVKGYRPYSTEKDVFKPHPLGKLEVYNAISEELNGIVTTLRGRLSRILLSQKRSRWDGNKRKGILNPSQLHQVVAKTSESVYRVRKDGIKLSTAVSILIDLSGSMGSKIRITRETAILLSETLNRIYIPFEMLGFSGDHASIKSKDIDRKLFSRWGSLDMYYFKSFEENYGREQKERIAGLHAHRENYDGESVLFAANRLLARPERKKILFVLSDGAPCAALCAGSEKLAQHLKSVVKELEKKPGLTLFGFGMLTDAPKRFYTNHILVNNLSKFPEVLMANLYKQLA